MIEADGRLRDGLGMLGALIDIEMTDRANVVPDTPIAAVRIVPVTILHPTEIDMCATGGEARLAMASDLISQCSGHVTDPSRASLR